MNRFTCNYKLAGTKTFRLASSKLLNRYGGNLQNVNRESRNIFIPDSGKCFVQVDQAGAEARVVAYECPRGNLQKLFECNIKPHTYLAMYLFAEKFSAKKYLSIPIEDLNSISEWKILDATIRSSGQPYAIGKRVVHAGNYGEGPTTFRHSCLEQSEGTLVLSAAEAKLFLDGHKKLFPEISCYHQNIEEKLKTTRELRNLFGYRRIFYERYTDALLRDAFSWIPQSTVGCITNIACTRMQQHIESEHLDWDLLTNTHDSYLLQCKKSEKDSLAVKAKLFIEAALISSSGVNYKMESEVQFGLNWGKVSKNNLEGMGCTL